MDFKHPEFSNPFHGGRFYTAIRKNTKLSAYEKLFLAILGAELDWSKEAWVIQRYISRERMAEEMGVSIRTVASVIQSLKDKDYLLIERRFDEKGAYLPSYYTIAKRLFDEYADARRAITLGQEMPYDREGAAYELNSRELNSDNKYISQQAVLAVPGKLTEPKKVKEESPTSQAWKSYSDAYKARYGIEPMRSAKINGQLSHIVKAVGKDLAPEVVRYYVKDFQDPWVDKISHSLDGCLKFLMTIVIQVKGGKKPYRMMREEF